jgi:hypothetical protein
MASIISKVTDLDKEMRIKVKKLEGKREKLPEFLREQKKELINKYETIAKAEISKKKSKLGKLLKEANNHSEKELKDMMVQIEKSYKENKDKWIEKIYNQCIEDYMGY